MKRTHTTPLSQKIIRLCFFTALLFSLFLFAGEALALFETGVTSIPAYSEDNGIKDTLQRDGQAYTCLILGKDAVSDNTDVIMLCRFHIGYGEISLMQIPRDTYFRLDGKEIKLGSLYSRLKQRAIDRGEKNPSACALDGAVAVLESTFALVIDHYLLVDLDTVRNLVDTIGGVTFHIPTDMDYDDPSQNLSIHLKQGEQTLDGDQAVQFLRFRSGYATADLGRLDAQKLLLSALFQKMTKPSSIAKITLRLSSIKNGVLTSIGYTDALYFLSKIGGISTDRLTMATMRGEAIYTNGVWYYVINRECAISDLNDLINPATIALNDTAFDKDGCLTNQNSTEINEIYRRKGDRFKNTSIDASQLLEEQNAISNEILPKERNLIWTNKTIFPFPSRI